MSSAQMRLGRLDLDSAGEDPGDASREETFAHVNENTLICCILTAKLKLEKMFPLFVPQCGDLNHNHDVLKYKL